MDNAIIRESTKSDVGIINYNRINLAAVCAIYFNYCTQPLEVGQVHSGSPS